MGSDLCEERALVLRRTIRVSSPPPHGVAFSSSFFFVVVDVSYRDRNMNIIDEYNL